MSEIHLERFNILLVEDNTFIRNTLEDLLRYFKIEQIKTAKNGEEAIAILKEMKRAQHPGPDIIISDLIMSPINGQLLLRWARTAKESPNRFVAFVMISGAADMEYVTSARDLGVSEFLAKPFSVNSVYAHITQVIYRPRPFIATQEYFGPDRRRVAGTRSFTGKNRRRENDEHVTTVYSTDKITKAKNVSDVWCFRLPNSLKEKAGGGTGTELPQIPADILEQAEQSLERAVLDFTTWAQEYLQNLGALCDEAKDDEIKRSSKFSEINNLAHELRGQGGTFGYPLISVFGKMLYESTHEGCPLTENQVEVIRAHIDAMRAVIRDKVAGDGGQIGKELLASLKQAIQRYEVIE